MNRKANYVYVMLFFVTWVCYADPVFVGNNSFEEPADGKHNMWDAGTNGKGTFTDVPYWTSDTDAADSGIEEGQSPPDGVYSGFLMSTDPAVWQITSEPIAEGLVYTLSVSVKITGQDATTNLISLFYVDDSDERVTVASLQIPLTSDWVRHSMDYVVDDGPSEAIGRNLGIMIENDSPGDTSWSGLDYVTLDAEYVYPISPEDAEIYVPIETDLTWSVANNWNVDVYLSGPYPEPNETPILSQVITNQAATTYNPPADLANNQWYHWQVDVREPNAPGPDILHPGPIWTFKTTGLAPEAMTISPAGGQAVLDGSDTVFTAGGVNVQTWTWYKQGDPNPLSDGADYAIAENVLTVLNTDVDDEGFYYCVGSNSAAPGETAQTDLSQLILQRMVGHWKLDGNLTDSVDDEIAGAVAHDGMSVDPNYVGIGKDGGALELSGDIDSLVRIVDGNDFFNFYPRGYTVSAWINRSEDATGWGAYVSKQGQDPSRGFILTNNGTEAIHTLRQSFNDLYSGVEINDNAWHLVTGTYDAVAKEGKIYVDGVLANETVNSGTPEPSEAPLIFGAELLDGSVAFEGLLDDVCIWSYPLDAVTIATLYTDFNPGVSVCVVNPEYDVAGPDGVGDEFRDCIVNVYDFVPFAQAWLECNIVPDCQP